MLGRVQEGAELNFERYLSNTGKDWKIKENSFIEIAYCGITSNTKENQSIEFKKQLIKLVLKATQQKKKINSIQKAINWICPTRSPPRHNNQLNNKNSEFKIL